MICLWEVILEIHLLFSLISFVFGIIILLKIRSFDLFEKEPIKTMLFFAILGGLLSIGITLLSAKLQLGILIMLKPETLHEVQLITGVLAGPFEEFSKLLTLYLLYLLTKKRFSEPIDGIIYISCISLGFSLIENVQYALIEGSDTHYLLFLRVLTSTPAHLLFSAPMGLAFYLVVKKKQNVLFLLYALTGAIVFHSLFNTLLMVGYMWAIYVLFGVLAFRFSQLQKLIQYSLAKSPLRLRFKEFLFQNQNPPISKNVCPICSKKSLQLLNKIDKEDITYCPSCDAYFTSYRGVFCIFRFFLGYFKNQSRFYRIEQNGDDRYGVLYEGNKIYEGRDCTVLRPDEIESFINKAMESLESAFENSKVIKITSCKTSKEAQNPITKQEFS